MRPEIGPRKKENFMKRLLPLIFTLASILTLSIAAGAATFTVTKAANSNDGFCDADCSLREAVAAANDGDTVAFSPSLVGQTFLLGGTDIQITEDITIDGNLDGTNVAFVSGNGTSRHFWIQATGKLTLRNIMLVQGNGTGTSLSGSGGSIGTEIGGVLDMDRVAVRSNTALETGAIRLSGGVNNRITNSSITGNTSGAITAIAVINDANVSISNTTVSRNRIVGLGSGWGAITVFAGTIIMRNCTVTENEAELGGGMYIVGDVGDVVNIGNSIIAGNTASTMGQDINLIVPATLSSAGGNLIGNTQTIPAGIFNQTKDVVNVNALLAPTNSQQGGHPIDTHPLQAGSPAIGGGINGIAQEPLSGFPLTTDARGSGFPRQAGTSVDKGAFEDQSLGASLVVTKLADTNDNVCDTDCSLREAVFAAGIDPGTDTITMAANVFGTISLNGEIPIQNQNVNIVGYPSISSETLVVSGSNIGRVFEAENSNVTLTGFTIADGTGQGSSQPFGGGAMRVFGGNLTMNQMIVRDNTVGSTEFGGAISAQLVNVIRIGNSTFTRNHANSVPALALGAGVTYITNTTISGNTDPVGGDCGGAVSVDGSMYMRNSTVTLNRCSASNDGAGILCGGSATCNFGNSVIANNIALTNPDLNMLPGGTLQSVGGNLIESMTGYNTAILIAPNDQIGVSANLLPLTDNGGNVPTHAPGVGSAALNTGWNPVATDPFSAAALPTDARGQGFSRISGGVVEKGAYEAQGIVTSASVAIGGRVLGLGGKGVSNALVTLSGPSGEIGVVMTNSFGYYRFEDVEVGHTYLISVSAKRYRYAPRVINLTDELLDLDLFPIQ
jgi:CSLREA domain-containing protein